MEISVLYVCDRHALALFHVLRHVEVILAHVRFLPLKEKIGSSLLPFSAVLLPVK